MPTSLVADVDKYVDGDANHQRVGVRSVASQMYNIA